MELAAVQRSMEATYGERDRGRGVTAAVAWLAEETGYRALALPNEPPESVLDLAAHFPGTTLLVVDGGTDTGIWPGILGTQVSGASCFERLPFPVPGDPYLRRAVEDTQMYRVGCR